MASSSRPPARGREIGTGPGAAHFTEAELAVADQLVQLSGSFGGDDVSPFSSSSSVNTGALPWEAEEVVVAEDDVEELDRRARKRYRLLSELYADTKQADSYCLGRATIVLSARKRKLRREPDGKAAMARYRDQSC